MVFSRGRKWRNYYSSSWIFNAQRSLGGILPFLQKEGYKVLAYDHYGRGYSSRPKTKYTKNLFIETLDELIGSQDINQKIHLVGYSMGGPIVAGFAESYPEKVKTISLIAPAGYLTLSLPWHRKFFIVC